MISSDTDTGRRIAREYLATYLPLPNHASSLHRLGFNDADLAGAGSDRLVDALIPNGSADSVARRVQNHFDAGADHVCVQPLGQGRAVDLTGLAELAARFA